MTRQKLRNCLALILVVLLPLLIPDDVNARPSTGTIATKVSSVSTASKVPACILKGKRLYGKVYIANSKYSADFSVYQGNSRYSTDLSVFSTSSTYSATSCGIWSFVNSKYSANFSIYFVNSKYSADFSIYFVNSKYTAGVN